MQRGFSLGGSVQQPLLGVSQKYPVPSTAQSALVAQSMTWHVVGSWPQRFSPSAVLTQMQVFSSLQYCRSPQREALGQMSLGGSGSGSGSGLGGSGSGFGGSGSGLGGSGVGVGVGFGVGCGCGARLWQPTPRNVSTPLAAAAESTLTAARRDWVVPSSWVSASKSRMSMSGPVRWAARWTGLVRYAERSDQHGCRCTICRGQRDWRTAWLSLGKVAVGRDADCGATGVRRAAVVPKGEGTSCATNPLSEGITKLLILSAAKDPSVCMWRDPSLRSG
jgi:hypothetical protein